jgi:small-conductance mechanosensitive channel
MSKKNETAAEKIKRLEAEIAAKDKQIEEEQKKNSVTIKVSNKGAVQVNGLRRFPVVFYADEWAKIFDLQERVEQFIDANESQLAKKK